MWTHFPSFPEKRDFIQEEKKNYKAMKVLQKTLFALVMVAGLSLAASAQKDDQKKPPKDPPVINPGKPQPTPKDPPKKPGFAFVISKLNDFDGLS